MQLKRLWILIALMTAARVDTEKNKEYVKSISNIYLKNNYENTSLESTCMTFGKPKCTRNNFFQKLSLKLQKQLGFTKTPLGKCIEIPSEYNYICPKGFQYTPDQYCIAVKENQTFPPQCPFPNFEQDYTVLKHFQQKFHNKTFWLYGFKNSKYGFPEFEWISRNDYGTKILQSIAIPSDFHGRDCVIIKNSSFHAVSCNEMHAFLCIYSYKILSLSKARSNCQFNDYQECILADYDLSDQKCFCKKVNSSKPSSDKFCEKLAEPIFEYQTEILSELRKVNNFINQECWIGLINENPNFAAYRWKSENKNVNYTKWIRNAKCSDAIGAFQFRSSQALTGWTFLKDRSVNCALCEVSILYEAPLLKLYQTSSGSIELHIDGIQAISNLANISYYDIHCFTDQNKDGFKETLFVKIFVDEQTESSRIFKLPFLPDCFSHCWCEAFLFSSSHTIESNQIVAFPKSQSFGYEFALEIRMKTPLHIDPFMAKIHLNVCKTIERKLRTNGLNFISILRPMRGFHNQNDSTMILLSHISTKNNFQTALEQHRRISEVIESLENSNLKFINFSSCESCLPMTSLTLDKKILEWPETRIGQTALPNNMLCLDSVLLLPVVRVCEGDFLYGSRWGRQWGNCFSIQAHSLVTEKLFNITRNFDNMSTKEVMKGLDSIIKQYSICKTIDVHLIATILERLVIKNDDDTNIGDFLGIVSDIMDFDRKLLADAQLLLNSTDRILASLDDILKSKAKSSLVSSGILVEVVNLNENDTVTGLVLFKKVPITNNFYQYNVLLLYQNTSLDDLIHSLQVEILILLPPGNRNSSLSQTFSKVIIGIFYKDSLFNYKYNEDIQPVLSKIVRVSFQNCDDYLDEPLYIWFRNFDESSILKYCSYWDYGVDNMMINQHGRWEKRNMSQRRPHLIEACEFDQLRHFALLLDDPEVGGSKEPYEIISMIGSALSLLGIIPIFITALIFRNWRKRTGNIILLNFCLAITFQICVTFAIYFVDQDGTVCKIIGASFHYSVLSEFCWMFVIALLEYKRFILVFNNPAPHLLRNALMFGWLAPLLPVIITLSVSTENYKFSKDLRACYLNGNYFFYCFLVPIALILINNVVVFVKIVYTVTKSSIVINVKRNRNYKFEMLLVILLFFILGLSWIFGIVGVLWDWKVFTYLFCLTATLRGLILFLFFIVGNKETRLFWSKRSKYYVFNNRHSVVGLIKSAFSK